MPSKTVLLKYMYSKIIRKGFQSIKELIISNFVSNLTEELLYLFFKNKIRRVFMSKNIVKRFNSPILKYIVSYLNSL